MDALELHRWLQDKGYTLGAKTRTEAHPHDAGVLTITYADKLLVEGPEEPPPEIMAAMHAHRDELLAACCMLHPPVPWLKELARRRQTGYEHVWKSRKGVDRKSALVTGISLECLAANVAGSLGHSPLEGERLEPAIRAVLDSSVAGRNIRMVLRDGEGGEA